MSMASAAISQNLTTIVGPQHLIAESQELDAYRIGGATPTVAIRPGSAEEVAEIVRFASAEDLAIVPTGSRTKLSMNMLLKRYDIALDVTRLDQIVSYDPADLTLSVEAGMPLHRLANELAKHRQFLPLEVPFAKRATVGGTIASGVDSPLRQAYGTARDYVLGMEFVTGQGKIVKGGGRVVKNVSGYDLHKLMIGSLGSLGVITKVNFRTFPMATSIRAFVAAYDSSRDALEARHRIAQSPLRPLTLEILSPHAAEMLKRAAAERTSPGTAFDSRWQLVVSFAGTDKILKRYEADLKQLAGTLGCELLDEEGTALLMDRLPEFVSIALESSPATVIVKISALPRRMAQLLDDAIGMAARSGVPWAVTARGVGVIYFALLPSGRDDDSARRVTDILDNLCKACANRDASIVVQWIPEEWRAGVPRHGSIRDEFSLMRKIKSAFDPHGVFASDPLSVWE